MMNLWIGLALMLVLALAFIVVPALRYRPLVSKDDVEERRRKNIDVFRQRQQELEQEHTAGQWNDEELLRLKTELERSFLRDMEALDDLANGSRNRHVMKQTRLLPLLLVVLIALPLTALLSYRQFGAGQDLVLQQVFEELAAAETEEQQRAGLDRLAEVLQARLERHSDDIQNGYMLGTLYLQLERFDEAIATFDGLVEKTADSPQDQATVLGQLAQAQYLSSDQQITPEVQATMDRALAINANEQAVMSLLAINAFLDGEVSEALSYWRRQLTQLQPGSREAVTLQQRINQVQEVLAQQSPERSQQQPEEEQASVTVRVSMSPEIEKEVDSSMRVFIFARSTDMPMPLAAQTFSVGELPLEIILDDSMAMMENLTLSSADNIIVGARISRSGQAIAESGDFQALSDTLVLDDIDGPVDLVISDIVP